MEYASKEEVMGIAHKEQNLDDRSRNYYLRHPDVSKIIELGRKRGTLYTPEEIKRLNEVLEELPQMLTYFEKRVEKVTNRLTMLLSKFYAHDKENDSYKIVAGTQYGIWNAKLVPLYQAKLSIRKKFADAAVLINIIGQEMFYNTFDFFETVQDELKKKHFIEQLDILMMGGGYGVLYDMADSLEEDTTEGKRILSSYYYFNPENMSDTEVIEKIGQLVKEGQERFKNGLLFAKKLEDYLLKYDGNPPLANLPPGWKDGFENISERTPENYYALYSQIGKLLVKPIKE